MRISWTFIGWVFVGAALAVFVAWVSGLLPQDMFLKIGEGLNWISPAVTAAATFAIAWLTRRLWQISQSELKRSQEIERAYVSGGGWRHLSQTVQGRGLIPPDVPSDANVQVQPNGDYLVLQPTTEFELHVNNHGKTPAFLHHVRVGFCDATAVPGEPPYGEHFALNDAIGPGDQSRRLGTVPIESKGPRTAICGRYYWRDVWGREWSSGFVYEIRSGPAWPNDSISIEAPRVYWEDRREPDEQ
jgi:hypothetical protein